MLLFFLLHHDGVEARATGDVGNINLVDIDVNSEDSTLEELANLVGNVEGEGFLYTVVEDEGAVDVVTAGVFLFGDRSATDGSAVESADAEGEHSSANDVDVFALVVNVAFEAAGVVDADGSEASMTGVNVGGPGHTRDVGFTIDGHDAAFIAVEDNLREIDVGKGLEGGLDLLNPHLTLFVPNETSKVGVDLDGTLVGAEEFLGLIVGCDGFGTAGETHGSRGAVGVGEDGVEGRALIYINRNGFVVAIGCDVVPDE